MNEDRIDLREHESKLDSIGAVLHEHIVDIESQMQRELAAWNAAR